MKYIVLKRAIDLFCSFFVILFSWPIILFAALLVWLEDPSHSPFLKQHRIGLHETPFTLLKLRTMTSDRFRDGRKLTDSERMLRIGRLFRKFSIDELPQLVNLIRGDMSFIGPRPMPVVYLPYFTPKERVRHQVRPGMSGLAQVNGRNYLSWDEKFAFDIKYVENFSLSLDLIILFKTLFRLVLPFDVVISGENITSISLNEERKPYPLQ